MDDAKLVQVLKALSDPKRFRMAQEIAEAGELSCGQLAERFDLSQPTISHHLKLLTDSGVVLKRHEAQHHFASIDRALLEQVSRLLVDRIFPPTKRRAAR